MQHLKHTEARNEPTKSNQPGFATPSKQVGMRASKTTFHADLKQVAAKMVAYEIMAADAKDVFALDEAVGAATALLVD